MTLISVVLHCQMSGDNAHDASTVVIITAALIFWIYTKFTYCYKAACSLVCIATSTRAFQNGFSKPELPNPL